jgi:integrase
MASIQKRPNGKWRARYRDDGGKEHARHFERKTDAQQWLDAETAKLVRGDWADPKAGRETLRAYAGRWEAIQVSSEGSARIVDNALRLHILPRLGDHKIAAIRRSDVQAFVKALEAKELAPGSVRNIYDVLARVMDSAVEDRVIGVTPCKRITLPKDHDDEVDVPALEEIEKVRAALGERWRVIPVVLAGSGVRAGELLGLRKEDVDFKAGTIRVERQRLQSNQLAPLKSKSSRRTVPVGKVVTKALAAHLLQYPASDEALFTDEWGEPLTYRRWKALLQAATKEAEVALTSHSFRHFAASALISGGASVKQVQTFLGHASAVITLRTYAHLFPGDEDRTRNVLDAALGPLALADPLRTEAAPN